eukprot:120925_1
MLSIKLIVHNIIVVGVIMKLSEAGTGAYYGNACYWSNYNLTWYPALDIIINTSDINTEYQYLYSPCNLSFYSSEFDQHFAMKRYDLKTGTEQYLIPELSNYPAETDPNQPITTYQFSYTYPNESCPDLVQIVYVYWQCNETINNYPYYYEMISAGPLFDCFDSIFIQSPFACNSKNVWPKYQNNCTFTSNDKTIHLNEFITQYDYISVSNYYWTPCRNKMRGTTAQEKPSKNNWATIYTSSSTADVYSTWNLFGLNENMYYYDPVINVWNFTYFGYNITSRSSTKKNCDVFSIYILFGCDCRQSREQYTGLIEPQGECYMIFNITRNDLCINYIDQCFPNINNTNCVYYYRPNASEPYDKLNLSSLTDKQIGGVEEGGLYAFIYTPCNNNFLCSNGSFSVPSMSGRKKINANECIEPLGIFNGTDGFLVTHDYKTRTWVIEYFNGGECPTNGDQTIHFRTTWLFSSTTEWKVNYVHFVESECLYDVSITSKFGGSN